MTIQGDQHECSPVAIATEDISFELFVRQQKNQARDPCFERGPA
jgi:hypothetical protein